MQGENVVVPYPFLLGLEDGGAMVGAVVSKPMPTKTTDLPDLSLGIASASCVE